MHVLHCDVFNKCLLFDLFTWPKFWGIPLIFHWCGGMLHISEYLISIIYTFSISPWLYSVYVVKSIFYYLISFVIFVSIFILYTSHLPIWTNDCFHFNLFFWKGKALCCFLDIYQVKTGDIYKSANGLSLFSR